MRFFDAPVQTGRLGWIPVAEIVTWRVMAWVAGRRSPERSASEKSRVGAASMLVFLGSEWGHNLAHAAIAGMIGKPADGIRIQLGLPRLIYKDLDDPTVTPREHILRALGGPLFNALLLPLALLIRRGTSPDSAARQVADIAVGTNAFLSTGSLLPIPGIDGGPILKWTLVRRGRSIPQANEVVRKVNGVLAAGLGVAAVVAHRRRQRLLSALAGLFAFLALGVASGVIKETGGGEGISSTARG